MNINNNSDLQENLNHTSSFIEKAENSWFSFFINNSKVAFLVSGVIFLWGGMAMLTIPKESAPKISYGIASISTFYDGASAVDMDKLITQEIENKIKDVNNINKITSSSRNSFSNITVEFESDTDMTKAMSDLRNKLDSAKSKLPTDAEDPTVTEIDSTLEPIFTVHLAGDLHPALLRDYAEKLKSYLESDPVVREVNISGGAEREIFVDTDPLKLAQYKISLSEIVSTIQRTHRDFPVGNFEIDNLEYSLRFQGQHKNTEDIKNIVVKVSTSNSNSTPIKIEDIAEVYESNEEIESLTSFTDLETEDKSRTPTITLNINKSSNTNIFKVDPLIRNKVLEYVKNNFGDSTNVYFTNEIVEQTRDSYDTVFSSGEGSIIIVFLLLAIFIGMKEALVTSFVIPLSFLVTIGTIKAMGETLNFMVNFSLILSLGILVDTSIVIVEGIYEGIKQGYTPKEAAIAAVQEFKAPLISGTLTTLAVFIPLLVLPGILGKYLSFIPISVSITLLASLLVSLLIIPAIASTILKAKSERKQSINSAFGRLCSTFYKKRSEIIERVQESYDNFTVKNLPSAKWRMITIYGTILLCILTFFLPVKFSMFPAEDFDYMWTSIKMPEGTTKEVTFESVLPAEKILLEIPEMRRFETNISNNSARISMELLKKDYRKNNGMRTSLEISEELRQKFKQFKNYEVNIEEAQSGPPGEHPVAFKIIAQDSEYLKDAQKVARDLQEILKTIPGTDDVKDDITNIPGEITYKVNHEEALRLWLDSSQIAFLTRTAIKGSDAITLTRDGREIDVKVRYKEGSIQNFDDIGNLQILNNKGELISLSQIVVREFNPAVNEIKRKDRKISVTISSELAKEGNALEITNAFKEKIKDYELPAGVEIEESGENAENAELFVALGTGFVMAVFLIFTILVIQFNSYSYPFIIVFTIVMSFLGVNIGLFVTGTPRSLAMIIGTISLAGIVVNDAIILVDRINYLREKYVNKPLEEIIAHAGATRLQPIVLTTLTTAAGVLPLVWVSTFWAGLSYTIIFGLMVASALTLVVTPCMYYEFTKHMYRIVYRMLLAICILIAVISLIKMNFIGIAVGIILFIIVRYFYLRCCVKMKVKENIVTYLKP